MQKNQIKSGAILSYVVILLNMIVSLGFVSVLTRTLGQSEYGLYALVASIISTLTILDFGFGHAIIVYTNKYNATGEKEKVEKLHGMFFIIYIIIGIISGAIGFVLYLNTPNMFGHNMSDVELSKAKIMMLILTVNLFITFAFSIYNSIITAYERFIFSKLVNIIRIILSPLLMTLVLLLGYRSISLVIITTLLNIGTVLTHYIYCKYKLKIKFRFQTFDLKIFKEISSFSFYVFLNQIVNKINWTIDEFIIGIIIGTSATAVYSIGSQLNQAYLAFATVITGVLLPKTSKMEAANAPISDFSKIFIKAARIQYLVLMLVLTGFILWGQPFMDIWQGPAYKNAYYITCIFMISGTIASTQNIGINILLAKNKNQFRTIMMICIAVFNVIVTIFLTKVWGGIGAALGTAIAITIGQVIIMNIYYAKKIKLDIKGYWHEMFKLSIPTIFIFGIGMLIVNLFDKQSLMMIAVQAVIYTSIYVIVMWLFAMNNEEKDICRKFVTKLKLMMFRK